MNLKTKYWTYGILGVAIVLLVNFIVLVSLNFPVMAVELIKSYWYLIFLLIGGFGLQIGLFTYFNGLNAISCSTTAVSGGASVISMILCCTHYLLNLAPFLGSLIGVSALASLSKYTLLFLWIGIISNIIGIAVIFYQRRKYSRWN